MKRIITFLEAVKHCEVTGHYSYNGYDIICDEKLILHDLSALCDSAITALIESQSPNLSLVGRLVEEASNIICDNIKRMEAEQYSSDLLRYRVLYYLNQQKRSLDRFRGFLGALGIGTADNIAAPAPHAEESTAAATENVSNVIEGISGLAEHLGCGVNKAQEISNSGILKKEGIQYGLGRKWFFNKSRLETYLEKNPEAFSKVRRQKS